MAAARITSVALETTAGQQLLIAAPIGIGIALTAMHITRSDGANTRNDDFFTTNAPRQPSVTEAAAGFTAGSPSLVPASTAGAPVLLWRTSYNGPFATANEACAAFNSLTTTYVQNGYLYPAAGLNGQLCLGTTLSTGATFQSIGIYQVESCPTGYSITGSAPNKICSLTSASAVSRPVDNVCPIVRSGNSYASDSTDPDCLNGQGATITSCGAGCTESKFSDSSGLKFSLRQNADGTSTITNEVTDSATNTTKRRTITAAAPVNASSPPLVTGVLDESISGTGTALGSSTVSPSTVTDPAATAALQDIAAKEAAIQLDRTNAETKAAAVPSSLAAAPWDISRLGLPSQSQFAYSAPSVPLPSKTGACVPLEMPLLGSVASVDTCAFVTTFTPIFNWLIVMMGVASGMWQIFSRKRD